MSFSFLTGEAEGITALSFNGRAALATLVFSVLSLLLVATLLWWRRRRGATLHVLSLSVWVPAVVIASLITTPIGGWGLAVAATQALVFFYAFVPIYLFFIALRWLQRRRA